MSEGVRPSASPRPARAPRGSRAAPEASPYFRPLATTQDGQTRVSQPVAGPWRSVVDAHETAHRLQHAAVGRVPLGPRRAVEEDADRGAAALLSGRSWAPTLATTPGVVYAFDPFSWLPDQEGVAQREADSLAYLAGDSGAEGRVQQNLIEHVGVEHTTIGMVTRSTGGGRRGLVDSTTSLILTAHNDDPWLHSGPGITEDGQHVPPTEGLGMAVVFSYERTIDYADRSGRVVTVQISAQVGWSRDGWDALQGPGGIDASFVRLMNLPAEAATVTVGLSGSSTHGTDYSVLVYGDELGVSLEGLLRATVPVVNDPVGGQRLSGNVDFISPDVTTGDQFDALQSYLGAVDLREVIADNERARQAREAREAAQDKPWYEDALDVAIGAGGAFANIFVEAGKQVYDMGGLGIEALGIATGGWDYHHDVASTIGHAAEQGMGTGDIFVAMGEGIIGTPGRFIDAIDTGDWRGVGREGLGMYFLGRGGYGMARGTVGAGFNLGVRHMGNAGRGLQWLGSRMGGSSNAALARMGHGLNRAGTTLFHARSAVRNWQLGRIPSRTTRLPGNQQGPQPRYDPGMLDDFGEFNPSTGALAVGEPAFFDGGWFGRFLSPKTAPWRDQPYGGNLMQRLRLDVGNTLRGNLLGRTVRHENYHHWQYQNHPGGWRNYGNYLKDPYEFSQGWFTGSPARGAWNYELGAPAGPLATGVGALSATNMLPWGPDALVPDASAPKAPASSAALPEPGTVAPGSLVPITSADALARIPEEIRGSAYLSTDGAVLDDTTLGDAPPGAAWVVLEGASGTLYLVPASRLP